jgi:twitching motility protein PilT
MARIDSILGIALQQGCEELRVATDAEPKLFARGVAKRLHLGATSAETLHELLGEILSPERDTELSARGRLEVRYRSEAGNAYDVTLARRTDGGLEVRFLKTLRGSVTAAPAAAPGAGTAAAMAPREASPPVSSSFVAAPVSALPDVAPSGSHAHPPVHEPSPAQVTHAPHTPWRLGDGCTDLFLHAQSSQASDLHLREGEAPVVRIDGHLRRLGDDVITDLMGLLNLEPQAARSVIEGGSLDRSIEFGEGYRARVHVYRTAHGLAGAVRFLPNSPPPLSTLGIPVPLDDVLQLPHGLVIVCGSTGSGKSTTLASMAEEAATRRSLAIVTLESPIEYRLQGGDASIIRQREVGRDVPDFAAGLRDALREDPDIIVVGEMRDPETIALALTAAETGHLVLATLHSGSAASAIDRIVDAYPPGRQGQIRAQLADVLRVVLAQRLLPRARGSGRTLAVEVLRVNHAAASMIREGKTAQLATLLQSSRREGMIPLERSLADRALAGDVRMEDARRAANDAEVFARYVAAARGT